MKQDMSSFYSLMSQISEMNLENEAKMPREKFTALKYKNFNFKDLEGIIKDADVLDIEEEASTL